MCLQFCVFVFNWLLPNNHRIYTALKRKVSFAGIRGLLQRIEESAICEGLPKLEHFSSLAKDSENPNPELTLLPDDVVRYSIPKVVKFDESYNALVFLRSSGCHILQEGSQEMCVAC